MKPGLAEQHPLVLRQMWRHRSWDVPQSPAGATSMRYLPRRCPGGLSAGTPRFGEGERFPWALLAPRLQPPPLLPVQPRQQGCWWAACVDAADVSPLPSPWEQG